MKRIRPHPCRFELDCGGATQLDSSFDLNMGDVAEYQRLPSDCDEDEVLQTIQITDKSFAAVIYLLNIYY